MNYIKTSLNLSIVSCYIKEMISEPFFCILEVISHSFPAIVGSDIQIIFSNRILYGFITEISELGMVDDSFMYRMTIYHNFYRLSDKPYYRFFHQQSTIEIIQNFYPDNLPFFQKNKIHDFIVQYGETDFNFLSRLLEQEGIFYTMEGKKLILNDNSRNFQVKDSYFLAEKGTPDVEKNVVKTLFYAEKYISDHWGSADYADTLPHSRLRYQDVHEYPGKFKTFSEMNDHRQRKNEERGSQRKIYYGESTVASFKPGFGFRIKGNKRFTNNYIVQTVEHFFKKEGYENKYQAFLQEVPFRPQVKTPKPKIYGYHSAIVVGPEHDEVFCDELGRIKVQFPFEDKMSCWIRVAQSFAGNGFGAVTIPRVGMEVVVTFLDADPDRPLVIGCLYHTLNRPPFNPEHEPMKSIFESSTHNLIAFNDQKGSEYLKISAQNGSIFIESKEQIVLKCSQNMTLLSEKKINLCAQDIEIKAETINIKVGVFNVSSQESINIHAKKNVDIIADFNTLIQAGENATHKAMKVANHEGELQTLIKGSPSP